MILDPLGSRQISQPHQPIEHDVDMEKIDPRTFVPESPTLPKDGVNKSSPTETTATFFALLSAMKKK